MLECSQGREAAKDLKADTRVCVTAGHVLTCDTLPVGLMIQRALRVVSFTHSLEQENVCCHSSQDSEVCHLASFGRLSELVTN